MTNDNDLEKLDTKLKSIRNEEKALSEKQVQALKDGQNMSDGMRAGMELIAPMAAGALLGWLLDDWLGTKPAGFIAMMVLGVITGFYNVYRISQNMGSEVGFRELHERKKNATTSPDEKES